jgi:tRNA A-37 threonylcarbamoyl transferase component Bud32
MPVDPKSWPALSQLLDHWLDLPEEQREPWLASVADKHSDLMPALRELISQQRSGFLETLPQIEDGPGTPAGLFAPGLLIGPYRLERELGRGGMAVVWLASRADGSLKRDLAIKFPLVYSHDREFARRFTRERDILGRLEDARIARLYDAGVTAQGQPYLALEFVDGEPITAYCKSRGLDIPARLKLFLDVLHAVQYAHTNLILHRDLKPSNILVTGAGQVRLLDFGIAKLMEDGEAEETEITRVAGRALTPDYASPEQLAGAPITTATDVYSLGILLYELLTGARPYQLKKTGAGGDMAARVHNVNPTRPSQAFSGESKHLAGAIRGDLDTIVLKAIEKEPQARYATADAFAQDIERHLSGQPVLARPAGAWYRARKFIGRNKLAVSSGAAIALALAVGAGIALWQAQRAVEEKRRADTEAATARAVADFLQKDLLAQASSVTQYGQNKTADPDIKVRTALDRAAAGVAGKFKTQPAVEAAIHRTIGSTYNELGLWADAQQQLTQAMELQRRVLGAANKETLETMELLARVDTSLGKFAAAEALLNNTLDVAGKLRTPDANVMIAALHGLGDIAMYQGTDLPRAESLYTRALSLERRSLGDTDPTTLATMNNLASVLNRERKYPQSEEQYRTLIELKKRTLGPEHPSTLTSMNGLAVLYRNEGKYSEAESLFKTALDARRRTFGETHRDTMSSMGGLGQLYSIEGKYAEAEPLLQQASETTTRVLGQDSVDSQSSLLNLAELYRRENKLKQSQAAFEQLLDARRRTYGPENAYTSVTQTSLAEVQIQLHDYAEANALLTEVLATYRKKGLTVWHRYYVECLLGASLAGLGRHAEAEPLLASGYQNLLQKKDSIPLEQRGKLEQVRQLVDADLKTRARP